MKSAGPSRRSCSSVARTCRVSTSGSRLLLGGLALRAANGDRMLDPLDYGAPEPDISHLITEDDQPVDNWFSEKQQRLLPHVLYTSYTARKFVALANVGLFFTPHQPAIVPDVMVSLDIETPDDLWEKKNRSYLIWEHGKPPDLVIEVVSNKEGGEADVKCKRYAEIRVAYYVIFDPQRLLSDRVLRCLELHGSQYVEMVKPRFPALELGLTLWEGAFEECHSTWLRWCDLDGNLLPTAAERAEQERSKARQAEQKAQQAEQKAQQAERETARLRERLREFGLEE